MVDYYPDGSLFDRIVKIYPSLTWKDFSQEGTIVLYDNADGNGPYILEWNHPSYAKPTKEQLDAAL
jgi:hypothetical protein